MKNNIAFAFLSTLLVAPVLTMAQEEAAAAPETAAPAAETASGAGEVAAEVAETVAETAEAVVDNVVSVFERASNHDAWDIRLSAFYKRGDNRDSVPDSYSEEKAEKYRYSEKEADVCFGIQPSATFHGNFAENQHYKLGYSPIYQYWTNPRVGSKRSELSHAALAEYRYVMDTRNEFTIRDEFKYIQNDYWYLDSSDVEQHNYLNKRRTEHEQAHKDNTLRGLWKTQLSMRTALELQAYWLSIRYDDDELAATEDEDKYVAIATLKRAWNSRFSYGIFGKYEAWDESGKTWNRGQSGPEDSARGIETYTIGLSATYRSSARLSIVARYGWEWIDYESDSIDDRDFPGDGDIAIHYAISMRTRGVFGVRYGVTEAWVYPFASQDLYSFYTTLRTMHTKRIASALRLEYKIAEYDYKYVPAEAKTNAFMASHDGEKIDIYAEFSLTYRWSRNFEITAHYSYEDVDSDVSTSYHENTYGIRATYLF